MCWLASYNCAGAESYQRCEDKDEKLSARDIFRAVYKYACREHTVFILNIGFCAICYGRLLYIKSTRADLV